MKRKPLKGLLTRAARIPGESSASLQEGHILQLLTHFLKWHNLSCCSSSPWKGPSEQKPHTHRKPSKSPTLYSPDIFNSIFATIMATPLLPFVILTCRSPRGLSSAPNTKFLCTYGNHQTYIPPTVHRLLRHLEKHKGPSSTLRRSQSLQTW